MIRQNTNVILMHGMGTNPNEKWYPWLWNKLDEHGITFRAPALPSADEPEIGDWILTLENTCSDEQSILVGHSRWWVAILRWLERLPSERKVKKVILVAVNSGKRDQMQFPSESNHGFYTNIGYDFEKIRQHCNDFVVFHSRDDQWVSFQSWEENAKGLHALFYAFEDKGHFGKGIIEIPELIDQIL